jgi:flagellin
MVTTVHTNAGALTALSALRGGAIALDVTSKRVMTGYRVADASDDAAVFSAAQNVRSRLKAYAAVQSSLAGGMALGEVTMAAVQSVYKVVGELRARIANLADGSLAQPQQDTYRNDVAKLITQINTYIGQATYNGKNILAGDAVAGAIEFVADVDGAMLGYSTTHALDEDVEELLGPGVVTVSTTDVTEALASDPPDTATALDSLRQFELRLLDVAQTVSAQKRSIEQQRGFVYSLSEAIQKALGALVEADLAAESVTLQSRQVARQLNIEALAIANQRPNSLLSLLP